MVRWNVLATSKLSCSKCYIGCSLELKSAAKMRMAFSSKIEEPLLKTSEVLPFLVLTVGIHIECIHLKIAASALLAQIPSRVLT